MWAGSWLAFALKILLAVGQNDMQPTCKKRDDCSECNKECRDAKLTLAKTNEPTIYKSQLSSPSQCFINGLTIELYRYNYSQPMCNNKMSITSNSKVHTWQIFSCDDKETMTSFSYNNVSTYLFYNLDMIFNGCYGLLYRPNGMKPKEYYSWIDNNVTEEEVIKRAKSFTYHNNVIRHNSPITIGMQYRVYSNKDYSIDIYNQSMENLNVTYLSNITQLVGGTEIKFYLPSHLSGGNYTVQYRCLLGWCHGEMFNKDFQVHEFEITLVNELRVAHNLLSLPNDSSGAKITVIAMCVLAITVLGLASLAYYQLGRRNILPEHHKNLIHHFGKTTNVRPSPELKGILLVYARDCEPFMRVMVELRQLLAQRCRVQVYDIYDVALSERLSAEWASAMLQAGGVHVVLVETKVGHLLYDLTVHGDDKLTVRPPLVPTSVRYRQHRFHNTFAHTLFHLVRHAGAQPDSYLKYSVVKIADFSDPRQFSHVNRYERFELPHGVALLAAKLTGLEPDPARAELDLAQAEPALRQALDLLAQYVREHPDYTDELLDL